MWLELYVLTLGILSLYLVYFRPYHAFQELGQGKMTSEPCSPNPSKFYLKKLKESKSPVLCYSFLGSEIFLKLPEDFR